MEIALYVLIGLVALYLAVFFGLRRLFPPDA
jgi:hypothetical protein